VKKLEESVTEYNKVKSDLMKISQCIDCCNEDKKEFYQDIALDHSRQLREIKESIESIYGIELCGCCAVSDK